MSNNSSVPPDKSPEKYLMKSVAFVPTCVSQDWAGSAETVAIKPAFWETSSIDLRRVSIEVLLPKVQKSLSAFSMFGFSSRQKDLSMPVIGSIEVSVLDVQPVRNEHIRMATITLWALFIFQS